MSFEGIKSDIQQLTVLLSVLAYKLLCSMSQWGFMESEWLAGVIQIPPEGLKSITSSTIYPTTCTVIIPGDRMLFFWMRHSCYTIFFLRVEIDEEKIEPALLINESEEKSPPLRIIRGQCQGP